MSHFDPFDEDWGAPESTTPQVQAVSLPVDAFDEDWTSESPSPRETKVHAPVQETVTNAAEVSNKALGYVLYGAILLLHWGLHLNLLPIPMSIHPFLLSSTAALAGGMTAAVILSLHATNTYVTSYAGFAAAGFNPISMFSAYIFHLLINGSRIKALGATLASLAIGIILPVIPLPTFPLTGIILIACSVPYLRLRTKQSEGYISTQVEVVDAQTYLSHSFTNSLRVVALVLLLSISPLLGQGGVVQMIFAFSALGLDVSESVTMQAVQERQEKDIRIQNILNPSSEQNKGVLALFSLVIAAVSVGIGAGTMGRRMGLSERTCFFLEGIVEFWNLKALLLLGSVVPQRSPLADMVLNMSSNYISIDGTSQLPIGPGLLAALLALTTLVCLRLSATLLRPCPQTRRSHMVEQYVSAGTMAVLCGFNPVLCAASIGSAWVAKRWLLEECQWTYPLIAVLGYQSK